MKPPLINLDRLDIQILSLLLADGRKKKTQISEKIGLSITPCCQRIKKLESAGIIQSYHAKLNLDSLLPLSYFRVQLTLDNYSLEAAQNLEAQVLKIPEIISCEAILGDIDYLLLFAATDMDHYQQRLESLLATIKGGYDYRTYAVAKTVKEQSVEKSRWLLETWGKNF